MSLLTKENFLTLFPNHILVAGRFKHNKVWEKWNQRLCNSIEEAERYNTLEGWKYDIFFTANWEFSKLWVNKWWTWRTKKSVVDNKCNLYAIVWDIDFWEKEREKRWEYFPEFTPTIVNKTKHWYHMFWLLKNPVDASIYLNRWEALERKLEWLLGIDWQAKDVCRILRVPWFSYWADNMPDDIVIENILYDPEQTKSFEEYEKIINTLYEQSCWDIVIEETLKKNYKKVKWMSWKLEQVFEKIATDVDVREVLETLYPRFQVRDNWTIFENWKSTRWYKWHKSMNYINNFSNDSREDRPAGWPFSIAYMHYWRRLDDTLKFFRDQYNINVTDVLNWAASTKDITFEKKVVTNSYIKEYKKNDDWTLTEIKSVFAWRNTVEDDWQTTVINLAHNASESEKVVEETEKDWVITKRIEVKTPIISIWNILQWIEVDSIKKEIRRYRDWTVDVLIDAFFQPIGRINEWQSWETYIIKISKKNWYETVRTMPKCWTIGKFKEFLMGYGLSFPNKWDTYLQYVYNYIFSVTDEYYFTDKLWYQKIWDEMVTISEIGTYVDEERKIYVKIEDNDEHMNLEVWDPNESIEDYVDQLVKWYNWIVSYIVFLAMVLWVNSYYIRNSDDYLQMPLVFIFWIAQSWKTILLKNIFKSFGIYKTTAAGSSAFVYTKNARHYLPINMSEFRNEAHHQLGMIGWVVRGLFDWTAIEKWRSDQSVVKYESNAQYIFDWQSMFSDDALQTRMLIVMTHHEYKWDIKCLRSLPNIYWSATNIFKDTNDFNSYIDEVYKKKEWIEKTFWLERASERIIMNYAYLFALSDRLWLERYNHFIEKAMQIQDWLCSEDDIARTYQKVFNLQRKKWFDYELYKWWLLIHILENDLPRKENEDDLRSFIQVINATFLSDSSWLGVFSLYVDFNYVYKKKTLHSAFLGMIWQMSWGIWFEPHNEEEYNALKSLKIFVENLDPYNPILNSFNFELWDKAKSKTTVSLEDVI